MATFTTLRTRLREDVLSEDDTSFFSDDDLLTFLAEASRELASMGGFPVSVSTSSLSSGSTNVSVPSDIGNVEFREVSFANYALDAADARTIRLYQGIGGQTRYYLYDPRQGGSMSIAPAAHTSGSLVLEYVQDLEGTSYSASDTPWGGQLEEWQDAIVYLAGVKAFERSMEYERAEYWRQRLERRLQSMAVYLKNQNLLNVLTQQGGQEQ